MATGLRDNAREDGYGEHIMNPPGPMAIIGAIAPLITAVYPAGANLAVNGGGDPATQLPEDTAYVVLFDTRAETWQRLTQYAFFQNAATDTGESPSLGGLAFLPAELDYPTTIAPWVGDTVALAVLPLPRAQPTTLAAHMVMVAPIDDAVAFTGFTAAVETARAAAPEFQRYQDVEILYWQPVYEEPAAPEDLGDVEGDVGLGAGEAITPQEQISPAVEGFDAFRLAPWVSPFAPSKALPEVEIPESIPAETTTELVQPGLAIAVLPDTLVTAQSPAAIRRWLEQRPTAATSLAAHPRFQRMIANPQYDPALGALYGNLAEIVKYALVENALDDLPFSLPLPSPLADISPADLAQLAALQLDSAIEAYLYPQQEGLRLQARAYYDNSILQRLITPPPPVTDATLALVPTASYLMISGQNLAGIWAQISAGFAQGEITQPLLDRIRRFTQALTGLDLDQDIFGWMDGDFAIFLFPTPDTPLVQFEPSLQVGVGIAIQTSDRTTAEATLSQLDQRLGQGFFTVAPLGLNGHPASDWQIELDGAAPPESVLAHGWAEQGDIAVITTSGRSLDQVIHLSERQSLQDAAWFQRATRGFPTPNQGYFYANISATLSLITNGFMFGADDPAAPEETTRNTASQQRLGTVQAISMTASFTEEAIQIDGLLMLSPADP